MQSNNILTGIVGAAVGLLLFVSFAMPVIVDAQTTLGDDITKTNDTAIVLRAVEDGDVLKCEREALTSSTFKDTWYLNNEEINNLSESVITWNVGLMSDGVYMNINAANNAAGVIYDMTQANPTPIYFGIAGTPSPGDVGTTTFTFSGGNVTYLTNNNATATIPYTWGYVVCPYDDGEYCAAVQGGVGYVKNASDVILCGAYTSGDLDTMYYHKGAVDYVSNPSYSMTTNISTVLTDGTTDIYTATVSVDITDGVDTENFTPYRILLPYEVTGHATSGTLYEMVGLLPLLLVVALVLGVIGLAVRSRLS